MNCKLRKCIFTRLFLKLIVRSFTPDFRTEIMVSFEVVWSRKEFQRFATVSTIRLKGEVIFFVTEFLEVFYIPSTFIVVMESF